MFSPKQAREEWQRKRERGPEPSPNAEEPEPNPEPQRAPKSEPCSKRQAAEAKPYEELTEEEVIALIE